MSKVYYYQFLPKYGCIKFSKTVFLRVMISNELCPPVKVWLLCDPMMGWCITRKQWLAPTSGSTVAHAAVCVLMGHIDALITSLIYTNPCNMILNTSWIHICEIHYHWCPESENIRMGTKAHNRALVTFINNCDCFIV